MSHALAPMRPRVAHLPRRIDTPPVPMPIPARAPQSVPTDRANCAGCGDDVPAYVLVGGLCDLCASAYYR